MYGSRLKTLGYRNNCWYFQPISDSQQPIALSPFAFFAVTMLHALRGSTLISRSRQLSSSLRQIYLARLELERQFLTDIATNQHHANARV